MSADSTWSQPCGTEAAFQRHYKRGEKPCEPCRLAGNAASLARSYKRKAKSPLLPRRRFSDPRVCASCDLPFMAEKVNQVYCSGTCRKRENNRRYQRSLGRGTIWRRVLAVDLLTNEPIRVLACGEYGRYIVKSPFDGDQSVLRAATPALRWCPRTLIWLDLDWMDRHPIAI